MVVVALPQDPALALLEVGWAPRAVEVVQRDRAGLHVGAHAHPFGGPDKDGDLTFAAGGEQFALLAVVAGLVDEPHPFAREPGRDESVAERVVDVPPPRCWGAEVGEDEL